MAWGCFAQKWGGESLTRSIGFSVKAACRASMVRIARCAVLGNAVVSASEDYRAIVGIYIYMYVYIYIYIDRSSCRRRPPYTP